jgi:signal peptidase II
MFEALGGLVAVFVLDRGAKASAFAGRLRGSAATDAAASATRATRGGFVAIRPHANRAPWAWRAGSPAALVGVFAATLAATGASLALGAFESPLARVGLGAALGGALGNVYDRLRHGAVLDFLQVGLRGRGRRRWSTTFNLADVAIVGGVLCVSVAMLAGARA